MMLAGVLALACVAVPAVVAEPVVVNDARVGGDLQRTRFVADLSREVEFKVFTLADPYRVIVDLPDVRFQLPEGHGKSGRGLVAAYRFGLVAPGKARIVLDISEPVQVDKAFVLPPQSGQPARLVVDLVRTDRTTFLKSVNGAARMTPRTAVKPEPRASPPKPRPDSGRHEKPMIVLDPGHGGIDGGARARTGELEKDVVFAFALTLREQLLKSGRYRVAMTRTVDTYVPLRERVDFARAHHGDLFISIHADSVRGRKARQISGATVYTLSEKASDEEARELAASENRSDVIAGVELPEQSDDVTSILIDLAQRETKNMSVTFAKHLLVNLEDKMPIVKKALRFAGFRVLKAPDVPSVLLEIGFMTNPNDLNRMLSASWRERISAAVVEAVDDYFKR